MCIFISLFQIVVLFTGTNEIPIYNIHHIGHIKHYPVTASFESNNKQYCLLNYKWVECSATKKYDEMSTLTTRVFEKTIAPLHGLKSFNSIREINSNMKSLYAEAQPMHRRFFTPNTFNRPGINIRSLAEFQGRLPIKPFQMHRPGYLGPLFQQIPRPDLKNYFNNALSMPHHLTHTTNGVHSAPAHSTQVNSSSNVAYKPIKLKHAVTNSVFANPPQMLVQRNMSSVDKFTQSLDNFERQFYMITFTKLSTISPADRQENGMSFAQSGFFLLLTLMALSSEIDSITKTEIERCIGFHMSDADTLGVVRHFISSLPDSSEKLKLRRSSRLMVWPGREVSSKFWHGGATALKLHVDRFNGTETPAEIATLLNQKVELDSGGAIHDTFDEDDVTGGVTAVLVTTLYVRGCWRTAPTVLNGTRPFHDHENAPQRSVRMIKINDIMTYADLSEWNAQALEISYSTPGLSLLMLIPRGNSLRSLVQRVTNTSIADITAKMRTMRVAAMLPLYTLRMTLLLPNKLQAMGIPSLVDVSNSKHGSLRLSHAVQRIMFWAEAGRNAYKDDGIEWDQTPDIEVVVDRPYIFFVRWRNHTLINGNFVL